MPDFKTLWMNYPEADKLKEKCFNKQKDSERPFANYCAILMSECLIRSGIFVNNCLGSKCWSHEGSKHVLLAEDLAKCLAKSPPKGIGHMGKISAGNFQNKLSGRTGIIFFKDYWNRGSENILES